MSELRERLQEAAEAAAREGRTPAAAALVKRGRHRRRRLIGGTAVLVILVVVVGMVGANRVTDRPTPLTPAPTAGPAPTTTPTTTAHTQRWIPSVTPLMVQAQPGPYPGPDPGGIVRDATSMVRGCQGKSRIRLWLKTQKMVWLVAAKPTPPGQKRVCWAHAFMNQGGGGGLGLGLPRPVKPLEATWAGGADGSNHLGVVSGTVTKRAVRLRVLFHKGDPLDLIPIDAGNQFPVNFYAGLYLESDPPPAEGQQRVPAVDRVLAIDQAGKVVAQCRIAFGPDNTC